MPNYRIHEGQPLVGGLQLHYFQKLHVTDTDVVL